MNFSNLNTKTTYSLTSSLIKPSELFKRAKELDQNCIAISDIGSLAAAWDCLRYAVESNVKLIMGCEFAFVNNLSNCQNDRLRNIILLSKNYAGWRNLLAISKEANDNGIVQFKRLVPRIDWKLLEKYHSDLICITAGASGILSQLISTRKSDEAKIQAIKLKEIFGDDLGLEVQANTLRRTANPYNDYSDQASINYQLIKFGEELNIKIVPTSEAHFLNKEDFEAQDVLLAIGAGQPVKSGSRLKYSEDFYLKSRQEIVDFFSRLYKEKAEEWCDNTLYFADKCEQPIWIDPKYSNPSGKELPEFPVKDQPDYEEFKSWLSNKLFMQSYAEDVAYLRYWCEKEFPKKVPFGKEEQYRNRLNEELEVIEYHNFSSYLLIVAGYTDWAKNNNILCGPGRGSCGSSLIGYLLGIHQADPIKYGLIFARFHNRYKSAYPDIDQDVPTSGRAKVINYIIQKYGQDRVAHVSNINTMTPKVYARDIARAFEFGGDRKTAVAVGTILADAIPDEIVSVEESLIDAPLFAEYANGKYPQLKKFAKHLGGKAKAWSTHAGGVIITKRSLQEFIPLRRDKEGNIAIEYEKERAESAGLVKMDILGLETLDIIRTALELIALNNKTIPTAHINYDECDKETYDLIGKGNTFGVFQFGESSGTIDLCKQMKPKCMEDLAAITALTRPGVPKEFRQKFIEMKFSGEKIEFLHPSLERSLKSTYGIAVFDECMLTLGRDVAGWDLNESDRLRKFIKEKGKHPEKDEKLKKDFIASTIKTGIQPRMANKLWEELFQSCSAYLFNKSHAITYSFLSYQTAYLKAHFPLEFLTANLMSEVGSNAKKAPTNIAKLKSEIRALNVKIIPPNINKSDMSYKIINDNMLMTGLDALKFLGKAAIPEILSKRPFISFEDFLSKVDGRKVNCKSVQVLAASGCLDSFGMTRKAMYLYASDYKKKLQVFMKRSNKEIFSYPWPKDIQEWSIPEKYAMEFLFIGEGLSGNVQQVYPGFFDNKAINFANLPKLYPQDECDRQTIVKYSDGTIEGVIKDYYEFRVKKQDSKIFGQTVGKISLEDVFGHTMSVTVWPDKLKELHKRLKELSGNKVKLDKGTVLHMVAFVSWFEGTLSLIYEDLKKCASAPPLPKDLEPKKVSMKISGQKKKIAEIEVIDEVTEEIEDELVEQGLSEAEDDVSEEDIWKFDAFN